MDMEKDRQEALTSLKRRDERMQRLVLALGDIGPLRPNEGFETLVVAIISQQISDKVKDVIKNRLEKRFGPFRKENYRNLSKKVLRDQGLSEKKAASILLLANSDIDFDGLKDEEMAEVERTLLSFKGVGPWTVRMFQIFAMAEEDILPLDDHGVKTALMRLYDKKEEELSPFKTRFSPHGSLAARYLWRLHDLDEEQIETLKKGP